jgi:RNA polymerase sigma factor (sigma-70 family)
VRARCWGVQTTAAVALHPPLSPGFDPVALLLCAVGFGPTVSRPPARHSPSAPTVRSRPHASIVPLVTVVEARTDLEAERELCLRAQSGDRTALGQILRRYGPILYRSVLLPRLGRDALAQDALAETYARVVERFHQFQWQNTGVYPWLRVVALRIALDILRARRRELLYDPTDLEREIDASEDDPTASGETELLEKRDLADARARVESALGAINPRYAQAIRQRVLEERSRDEVAAALGVSVATFDVVLHRALTALKKALQTSRSADGTFLKEASR